MKLFNEKYVRVKWNDDLSQKLVFVADECTTLEEYVDSGELTERTYTFKSDRPKPFHSVKGYNWAMCYYDPNYEIKVAYETGNKIQFRDKGDKVWKDCKNAEFFFNDEQFEFRIKPKLPEEQHLTLMGLVAAINNKEQVQYTRKDGNTDWIDLEIKNNILSFETDKYYYRIKPNVSRVIREVENNIEDEKPSSHKISDEEFEEMTNTWEVCADYGKYCLKCDYQSRNGAVEPCRSCTTDHLNFVPIGKGDGIVKLKETRPFENSAELISHYISHFNARTVPYGEPLIWIKSKADDRRKLITTFNEDSVCGDNFRVSLKVLYEDFVFLDDSECGICSD